MVLLLKLISFYFYFKNFINYKCLLSKKRMKKTTPDFLLKVIVVLSLLGLITSLYLVENHYANSKDGSFCDINATVSCSLVNTSIFSELFNVPVAIFGVLWFLVLSLVCFRTLKNKNLVPGIFGWSVIGVLFVFYMITAEIILKALCPFCTVVHIIVLIILVLSVLIYKNQKIKLSFKYLFKSFKPWLILIIFLNLIPLFFLNLPQSEQKNYDNLAQCITNNGINMYGSFRCSICAKTRKMFGDSFQFINEIECHPQGENPQTELCLTKGIAGTPTWVLEPEGKEIKRQQGFLSIEELAEFSGCEI